MNTRYPNLDPDELDALKLRARLEAHRRRQEALQELGDAAGRVLRRSTQRWLARLRRHRAPVVSAADASCGRCTA
jgi:hypothetical protein